ncbi:MAG: response regulator [Candidatus Kuenenia sp.]|nr:response regulator [Candidatus Kuenenia hertensis]
MRYAISTKIILLVLGIILLFSMALGYYVISYQTRFLKHELKERVTILINNLSLMCEYPLISKDKVAIAKLVKGVLSNKEIIYCRIENSNENVFYEEGTKADEQINEYKAAIVGKKYAEGTDEELLQGVQEEMAGEIGKIYLGVSMEGLNRKVERGKRIIIASIIFVVTIISLAIYWLLKRILGIPIKQLVIATEMISKGNLEKKVAIKTNDEIGLLSSAFNKMTENLLQTTVSRDYVDNIINNMMDCMIVARDDGIIKTVNKTTLNLLDYAEEELLGQPIEMVFGRNVFTKKGFLCDEGGIHTLLEKGSVCNVEKTFVTKYGKEIPVLCSYSVMRDTQGNIEGIVYVALDITERKYFEHELEEKQNKLELRTQELRELLKKTEATNLLLLESNKAKSKFLSTMSHELRTPLNGILGLADILTGKYFGELNSKQMEYVKQINDCGKHLLALISDILDVAKIDAGAMELEISEISPDEFINATVAMVSTQFNKKKIKVNIVVDKKILVIIADRRKCKQIMFNLLSNACKYTPEGGQVEIKAYKKADSEIRVEVTDTGIGIEEKDIDKIFSEFYQAEQVRDEQLGGTGIGLALTRRLVELHGGNIGVKSSPGKGSSFWFTLPQKNIYRKEVVLDKEEKAESMVPTANRILVVDDNEVSLTLLVDILKIHNHKIMVARNGKEALEIATKEKPELILMDIMMPVMDGIEATKRLRTVEDIANIPIIALTASTGDEAVRKQIEAGCDAHLAKPIRIDELFAVISKFLNINRNAKF